MVKVKMLFRHHGKIGKMEKGFIYSLPSSYAEELINHGLAETVIEKPISVTVKEIGQVRGKSGKFISRSKAK